MWPLRVLSSALFLMTIILTVPLTFDVGGRTCGLAYSLSLSSFYFFFSVFQLLTPEQSRIRQTLVQLLRWSQPVIVVAIFLWSLGRFSVDAGPDASWVEHAFDGKKRAASTSILDWLFGHDGWMEFVTIFSWDKMLKYSSPIFQLCEGFCSLLVIQAAGQLTRWLVNRGERSDSWLIIMLVIAASVISSSVYFLYRVMQFPEISNMDSSLIGAAITCSIVLCVWGIGSGRGNPIESSLFFAYVVLCIYQIFTDYKPSDPQRADAAATVTAAQEFPPFPPIIMLPYTSLVHAFSNLPSTLIISFNFITAAFQTITPSVLISLGYRLFVLYASTRIIPAVNENGPRGLSVEPTLEDSNAANQFLAFLSWFSPSILISVYTSLLMQHFATTMGGYSPGLTGTIGALWNGNGRPGMDGNLWKWVNLVGTMALYAIELWLGQEADIDGAHWKVD